MMQINAGEEPKNENQQVKIVIKTFRYLIHALSVDLDNLITSPQSPIPVSHSSFTNPQNEQSIFLLERFTAPDTEPESSLVSLQRDGDLEQSIFQTGHLIIILTIKISLDQSVSVHP